MDDYSIYQNKLLGAHAIWEFSKFYQQFEENNKPPPLILALPVLPIVFNKRAMDIIKSKKFREGSLIKTISQNKDIYVGLQDRMEDTADITLSSIYMAAASNLIMYDRETTVLIPNSSIQPKIDKYEDYSDIISSSKRIGAWFAQLNIYEIMELFQIHF